MKAGCLDDPGARSGRATGPPQVLREAGFFAAPASGSGPQEPVSGIWKSPARNGNVAQRESGLNVVFFANGLVLGLLALMSATVALLYPETRGVFAEATFQLGLTGTLIAVASRSSFEALRLPHAFMLTASVWLVAAIGGAVPLYLWKLSAADAFFEAMSGITTTGSTVMTGLDGTPKGILMWRALLQALGGVGFIGTGIALLPVLKVGGMQLFRTESSDKGEKELRNATQFAAATLLVYVSLMTLCGVLYRAGGMSLFDAVTHAMTTLSTGGYSTHDASFGFFANPFLQWTCTLFMVLGSVPFSWYIRSVYHGKFRSEQVGAMLKTLAAVILPLSLWLGLTSDMPFLAALRLVAFNVVSVVSTTGYATTDYTTWGPVAVCSFVILTAVGGCTGSTAGGAKAMRWVIVYRLVREGIRSVRYPHGVYRIRYEGRVIDEDIVSSVIGFFSMYALSFAVIASLLTLVGLDGATALSGAITALANVGPGVGDIIGPAGTFQPLSDKAKTILAIGMYLGRLEMLTVLVLLTPRFWRSLA